MSKRRFLCRQAKVNGARRKMVMVGVPDFNDDAKSSAAGVNAFQTALGNDDNEDLQELEGFKGYTHDETEKFLLSKIGKHNATEAISYDKNISHGPVVIQSSIVGKMDCEKVQQDVNEKCELNKSNNDKIVSCSNDANFYYTYAKSCKGGPSDFNQTSGEVQCGICGVIRYYKSIAKTKKYGTYSCDICRKFIAKSIENQTIVNCNNERGIGQCLIPIGFKSQNGITRIVSTDSRCKVCWLQMCLKRLKLPEAMVERLIDTLPKELEPVLLWVLKRPNPWAINVENNLQKKIIKEYKLQKEIISALRDEESDSDNELNSSEPDINEHSDKSDSDSEYTTKKGSKRKKLKLEKKSKTRKTTKTNKKTKKTETCRDVQSNDIKRVGSLRSTNYATPTQLETKALSVDSLHCTRIDENRSEKVFSAKEVTNFKNQPTKYTKMSNSVNNEQDLYLSIQPNRTLQDLMMQDHLNANIENFEDDQTIEINFRESYDPDKIAENGFAIVGTEPLSLPHRAVCFLCGSAGMEKLIHCVSCCEPYHKFCVDGVGIGISSHESEWSKISWTCPKCKVCNGCKNRGKTRPKLTCQRCKDSYHENCLVDKIVYDPNRPWACPSCKKCKSCHVPKVDYFVGNLALCTECYQLRQHGNYCPLCQNCYKSDDYESKMMECATCKHWVHAQCEGLTNEKYEVLSTLPDFIEYVCKNCTTESTVPWRMCVDEALKSGFMTVLVILGKNKKTCDLIKWSPQKQSPGCVCKKLVVPKFSSLDSTNDISPKNTLEIPKQCVCHGLEGWSKGTPTLVTIKQKVNNNEYESICQFNYDMLNTIDKFNVPELREEYKNIVTTVFPWFNSDFEKNSLSKSSYSSTSLPIISPPKFIPKLSFNLLNSNIKVLQDIMGSDDNNYYLTPKINDTRICQFCKKLGEGMPVREGRLLYCGDNVWAHANCALWSSEVFEEIDGSLQNVQLALSRGKFVRCVVCNEKGASVGCCYRNCVKTYHFQCARKVFCVFNENKTVYCNNHASDVRCSVKDFTLERLMYIEQEDLKHKRTESSEIHILIGSLYISSIGHLHPFLSDSVESILPIDFKAKRYYWSTKEPWKLIQYSWTTKMENYVEKLKYDYLNFTIDHNEQQNGNDISVDNCEQNVNIDLFTSIQVSDLQKCYEALKRKHPIDTTFDTKRYKMDNIDCFGYSNYDTNTELESTIDETCRMELFSNSYGLKSKTIPQFDGLYDSTDSSDSESEYNDLCEKDDSTNDQPVRCNRCHRTYRTSVSYDRHLVNCNFDYEIDSDSESSDDDISDKKVEDDCLPPRQEQVLLVEPLKEDNLQHNYDSGSPTQTSQQQLQQPSPPPTVILQPLQTSFIQPPVSDVQYIAINSTPPQSVMPCFHYQSPPTVIVQPPVVDPTTIVLNNSPVDMYVSQSNNVVFSPQHMIVGLDQYNMSPNYTFTQSPQVYHPTEPVEPISNQYYIINTEPTVSNQWSCNNITSEIKTERKVLGSPPKVYSNRKVRSTECYDTKENIPNSLALVQSIEKQVNGVMNIMRNINPEPWKKPIKTYPPKKNKGHYVSPKRLEVKKILPKCVESHSSHVSTSENRTENNPSPKSVVNTKILPVTTDDGTKQSPVKLVNTSPTTNTSNVVSSTFQFKNNAFSLLRSENKPTLSSAKVLPSIKKMENINPKMCLLKSDKSLNLKKLDINTSSLVSQHTPLIAKTSSSSLCLPVDNSSLKVDESSILKIQKPELVKQPEHNFNKELSVSKNETSSDKVFSNGNITPSLDSEAVNKNLKYDKSTGINKPLSSVSINNNSSIELNSFNSSVNGSSKNVQDKNEKIVLTIHKQLSEKKTSTSRLKNYPGRQWSSTTAERTVPQLLFEMNSVDGVFCKDRSLVEIWTKLFEAVQDSRIEKKMPQMDSSNPFASDITAAIRSLGLSNNFLKYLLEQLAGAKEFVKYKPTYHKGVDVIGSTTEDHSGCARTNIVVKKKKYDMFSWLASRHRKPPKLLANHEDFGGRRANSLPNEMKYRNMNKSLTSTVGVYRSDIHGRGLFCLRDIEQGEYVIEYTGEVIRSAVSDVRERLYNKKGIDCYMFRINQDVVVDATMNGNSSRFINHSCEPNCHSKIETIHGKKHIMILAKRKLLQGEELTYDYKFPLEDDKITCHCLSRKCRKYLN